MISKLTDLLITRNLVDVPDENEFEKFYREHQSYIRSVIYWMVRNDQVDDLVQDVFVKAWRNFGSFKGEASHKTWLYRIARNRVIDYYRSTGKNEVPALEVDEFVEDNNDELKDIISKALLALDLKHREVFVLHYKFGHSSREIGELLDTKEGTIKSRLYNAREKVKEILVKYGVEDE